MKKNKNEIFGLVNHGYLLFPWKNRKFRLANEMVGAIPFGKLQKTWAVILATAIFLLS